MENRNTLLFITHGIREYNGGEIYNYNDGIYINITTQENIQLFGMVKKKEEKINQ